LPRAWPQVRVRVLAARVRCSLRSALAHVLTLVRDPVELVRLGRVIRSVRLIRKISIP
jgi:hypothetical protein